MKCNLILRAMCCVATVSFTSFATHANGQVTNAAFTDVQLPLCSTCSGTAAVNTLNCDMLETDPATHAELRTIAWGDATGNSVIPTGFYVEYSGCSTCKVWTPLPTGAHTPDIVLGSYPDPVNPSTTDYLVAVVYELTGDIYLNVYSVAFSGSSLTVTSVRTSQLTTDGYGIPDYGPHIDLFADNTNHYVTSGVPYLHEYAIVYNGHSGSALCPIYNLFAFTGDLLVAPPSVLPIMALGTGEDVDIAAVSDDPSTTQSTAKHVYYTYSSCQTDLYYGVWDVNSVPGPVPVHILVAQNKVLYPRIEAMPLYDGNPTNTICQLAASVQSTPSASFDVMEFHGNSAGISPGSTCTSVGALSGADNLMPAVCGTGAIPTLGGGSAPGNNQFTLGYYSTYTNLNPTNSPNTRGDYFAQAMRTNGTLLAGPGAYSEVNKGDLWATFSTSNKPVIAVSNCSNTGYDLLTTWFDGESVRYKVSGGSFAFRQPAIAQRSQQPYMLYPVPASNTLNISGVTNADYTISDITGRRVANGNLSTAESSVNIQPLLPGLYFITLKENNQNTVLKFSKE